MGATTAKHIQLASPNGVGYGEEATIKLQGGLIYQVIELETNLVNKPTLKRVTIDIGGTPIVYYSGADLELYDRLYGLHQTTGRLVIDLSKYQQYRTLSGIHQTALATSMYDDITLKVEFSDKAASDPDTLTLRAKAYVSANPQAQAQGGGRVWVPDAYEVTQYVAAAGEHEWTFPNGSATRFVQSMILDETEVNVSKVTLKRGLTTIGEMTRSDINHALQRHGGVTLQAGKLLLDFTQFGFGRDDALSTNGLSFKFDVDSDGAVKTRINGFRRYG